jgi:cytochrome c
MMRGVRGSAVAAVIALAGACAPPDSGSPGAGAQTGPERFGFGTPATEARVAAWDIDVKPDGEGLPAGRGSVAEGETVYRAQCAACHGVTGTEGPNDRLVGTAPWDQWPQERGVGNYWPYATTLFDYVSKAMPQMAPGTLTADQTYAVIAYVLFMNGLVPADAVMSAETLAAVVMPARDKFVPDDRRGGVEVR